MIVSTPRTHHFVDVARLPKNPQVVDAGACRGSFCMDMLEICPDAQIVAFEPCPENYAELLKVNITAVSVNAAVVGEKCGPMRFTNYRSGSKGYMKKGHVVGHKPPPEERYTTEEITVDTIPIAEIVGDGVDYLKLDVEGAEYGIMENLKGLNVGQISIEVHDDEAEIVRALEVLGYYVWVRPIVRGIRTEVWGGK